MATTNELQVTEIVAEVISESHAKDAPPSCAVDFLQVPDIDDEAASRRSSVSSTQSHQSNAANSTKVPAKWFYRKSENRRNTSSTIRTRGTSGASSLHSRDNDLDNSQDGSSYAGRLNRKKSVMHGFMKRGRTIRKTMRGAMQINEADPGGGSEGEGRGYALTSEQRLRMYVLKEILDTEDDYTKLLQFIVEVIIPSLERLAKDHSVPCVDSSTVPDLLSNIRDIHKLHIRFSSALKDISSPYPYHTNCMGNVFLQHRSEFNSYGEFCANFSKAQKLSYKLQEDPQVMKLIEDWKNSVASKTRKFLHLEGFIISPVQRLCKYPLLLRELTKFTPTSHSDYKPVQDAMTMMDEVTTTVNETQRRAITMQAIRDVDDLFDSWEKSANLSKQGFMTKQGGSIKSWNIRWFTLSGYELKYFHEPTDTKPLGVLDLTSYKGLEVDASYAGRPFCFSIKMPDRVYYMYVTSEQEKTEWLTILQWKMACVDRSRKQAHRPFETVIFSSLSSFLHPKERIESPTDTDGVLPLSPTMKRERQPQSGEEKTRSKSLFKSFRLRRKQQRAKSIGAIPSHSQDS